MTELTRRETLKLIGAGTSIALGAPPLVARADEVSAEKAQTDPAGRTLTDKIADYIVSARFEDLPPAVVHKAKEQLIFFFGRAFETLQVEEGREAIAAARQAARVDDGASVIGTRLRLPASDAAFVNATLYGGSSGDDVLANADIHAGVVTVPPALALGEIKRVHGRELLLSLVLGYEVLGKLGKVGLGWRAPFPRRSTNIFGGYGPLVVGGRLLKLDRERMGHALGYAANLCMGIAEGSMMEHYYSLISRNGTFAAQLVEAGGTSYSNTTLEGELGLYRSFFGKVPEELPKEVDSLGYWEILTAVQKRYRGTGHNTTGTEMFADMVAREKLTPDKVKRIQAVLPSKESRARELELSATGPFKPERRAASSLAYALALVLNDGKIDVARFDDDSIVNDRALKNIMNKIDVTFEPGHATRWTRLVIHTADGRTIERESDFFTFEFPRDTWDDWLRGGGSRILFADQLLRLEQLIANLENVDDVSKLLAAATPAATAVRP
jgi:2-methylcitrate dehydratase PrpD